MVTAIFATAGIANVYRAPSDRSASQTIITGFIDTAASAGTNILREFISKPLTKGVQNYAETDTPK